MAVMKKGLAVFLVVIAAVSTIAISAFADNLSSYTVETYFMNTNGAYASEPDSTDREYVNVGSEVQLQFEEHEGFTVDSAKSDSSVIVAEDGSTVAKIYYQRNKYTLTYYYEDLVGPQSEEAEVYYGAEIPAFEANPSGKPAKTGYDFIMWSTDENERTEAPDTMPANDVDLYPIFELKTFTYTFDAGEGSFSDGEQIHTYEYFYGDVPVRPEDVPALDNYEFADWDADLPSFVDGDITFYAMYNEKCYTVYFYDGEELISACDGYFFGDSFEDVDAPEGYDAWTFEDGTYVEFPYEIKGDTYFYVPDVQDEYDSYLGLKTELYTYDETVGDWVVADKVGRNQEVKARVFIETGFPAGDGQVLFFYNDDAFESDYIGNIFSVEANGSETSTTGKYSVSGLMTSPSKSHASMKTMIEHGYFTEEFLENNTPVTFSFYFTDYKCHQISGDEWFAEFTLRTKSDAVGNGDFFIVPATIQNPDEGYFAYTTFAKGESEGASSLDYTLGMDEWEATLEVESNPVSTGYGRLIVDAGEGAFDDGSSVMKFDYPAGSVVDVYPEPTLEGYVFDGYEPEIPDTIEDEVVRVKAKWAPAEDTAYSVTVHYVDFEDGEAINCEDTFEFAGTTDSIVEIVDEMPESPEYNTEYILVDDLAMNDYNIVDVAAENIISAVIAADGSTVLEIFFKLASYEVEFYADEGTFPDGSNIFTTEAVYGTLTSSIVPEDEPRRRGYIFAGWNGVDETEIITDNTVYYALWEAEKYDYTVFFLASGDVPENFVLPNSEIRTEGDFIIIPEEYSADGYIFEGWYYNGERYESGSQIIMPAENITLICKWKRIAVETTTKPVVTETTTVKPTTTTTKPVVTETTTVKPTTTTKPVVTETTTVKPTTTTKPVVTETTTVKPTTTTNPVVTETTTVKPTTTTTKPVVTETTTVKPTTTTTKPVVTETTTVKPTTTTKPVVTETTTVKPTTTTKPVVTETTTVKPTTTTTKPVVTETTTTPATTKPVVTEPETTKPAEPTTKPQTVVFEIRQPSLTTIKYGDSIILHADVVEGERPQDVTIEWTADNGNFTILSVSEDGSTCTVTPNSKGDTVFTITVFDKDGNEIGSDTQKMTSKAGFFQKIIAFFKKIFGLTKVYPQGFKDVI